MRVPYRTLHRFVTERCGYGRGGKSTLLDQLFRPAQRIRQARYVCPVYRSEPVPSEEPRLGYSSTLEQRIDLAIATPIQASTIALVIGRLGQQFGHAVDDLLPDFQTTVSDGHRVIDASPAALTHSVTFWLY